MIFAHGITPFKRQRAGGAGITLDDIYSTYSPVNMWSADNVSVVSTTTTATDYAGVHNLANPAASNQPTLNATDSNFNNNASLTFDGTDDYLYKATANYRSADTGGEIVSVYKANGAVNFIFTSCDEATTTKVFTVSGPDDGRFGQFRDATNNVITATDGTVQTDFTNAYVLNVSSDNSNYRLDVDGTNKAISMFAGSDDGNWLDSVSARDNIAIGARITSSPNYQPMDWGCTLVFSSQLSAGNRTALIADLKTYYGIS